MRGERRGAPRPDGCKALACGFAVGLALWRFAGPAAAQTGSFQSASIQPVSNNGPPPTVEDLRNFSIEQLADLQVTSVTKQPQALSDAPASIYVITHDAIIRSGAKTIPEMLRLAPNLQVEQTSASNWIITARGFNGNTFSQAFSDKLLVLIDGRSVYTPLYSGVYWDMIDVPPDDIDRIEVISGPGATQWGANAVNGVINIITKKAGATQGVLVDVSGGDLQSTATLQYGGQIGDNLTWRVYGRAISDADTRDAAGHRTDDNWSKTQGGFRADWTATSQDAATLQGDFFRGAEATPGAPNQDIAGANVLGRWDHTFDDGGRLQVQAYFDQTERGQPGPGHFILDTYDLDIQDSFRLGDRNNILVGGGYRYSRYDIVGTGGLLFVPAKGTLDLSNLFVQDTVTLTHDLTLVAGLKMENDPYSGSAVLPDLRLSWKPANDLLLWAAASRAIRSPTPFDVDVQEKIGSVLFLAGDPNFQPEVVTAYEVGARAQPTANASFSLSAYYNVYNDLRTIELGTVTPLTWGNLMRGRTYGLEAWGDYNLTPWWRLEASVNLLHEDLAFKAGASRIVPLWQAGDDPAAQAQLKSSMDIGSKVTWDADLRYVDKLPNPAVPAYAELDTRIGWAVTPRLELSIAGFNLLHAYHMEYGGADAVPRSIQAELRVRF
ncbi:MAG TPA: TonB-dependent receptor [Caulobacteraceae bacterium]|nr:TonB-dependent receptor [Caulobacteraceae bacterium]